MNLKQLSNSQLNSLIDEWIHSERDRKIMKRRFIDGIVYERLAEEFDISDRHIKNITYKLTDILNEHIT